MSAAAKIAYRVDEACEAMGLGKTTIYELIKTGKLRTKKVGTRTLIPAEDLRALLDSNTEPTLP